MLFVFIYPACPSLSTMPCFRGSHLWDTSLSPKFRFHTTVHFCVSYIRCHLTIMRIRYIHQDSIPHNCHYLNNLLICLFISPFKEFPLLQSSFQKNISKTSYHLGQMPKNSASSVCAYQQKTTCYIRCFLSGKHRWLKKHVKRTNIKQEETRTHLLFPVLPFPSECWFKSEENKELFPRFNFFFFNWAKAS